jgi:hypothetical protein
MSNEAKTENVNAETASGKNDSNRTNQTPKSGQQLQGSAPQTDRGSNQQGGTDHKSGQQSQGGSQNDSDRMKQAGSSNSNNDAKKTNQTNQANEKGGASK